MLSFFLTACDSQKSNDNSVPFSVGFSSGYEPPEPDYIKPDLQDRNFKIHEPVYTEPYWVTALIMENGEEIVNDILSLEDTIIYFSFPMKNQVIYLCQFWVGLQQTPTW